MFTIQQIQQAHSKVKSGADFPKYIQDLIQMGLAYYDLFVQDGHAEYVGKLSEKAISEAKYPNLTIAQQANIEQLREYLKIHQQGKTDYLTFCQHAAQTGVEKWRVDMEKMTCTYYDIANNSMVVETIPTP